MTTGIFLSMKTEGLWIYLLWIVFVLGAYTVIVLLPHAKVGP